VTVIVDERGQGIMVAYVGVVLTAVSKYRTQFVARALRPKSAAGGLITGLAFKGQVVVDLPTPLATCGVFALYSVS
jgi:hypothetical protein